MDNLRPICKKCAKLKHNLCLSPNNLLCEEWVDYRASCRYCKFLESCTTLGKIVGNLIYCLSYEKGNIKHKRKSFDDYEQYLEQQKLKKEKKRNKKKTKDKVKKGFIELTNTKEKTPIKSPLIQKSKKKVIKGETLANSETPELWSPLSLIEEVISSDYDPQAFALVDERDLPKSHNIISFITEPKFLGQPLYPRQYQILLDFFASYCPHCSDTKFIREKIKVNTDVQNIKDRTILYRDGICPKCKSNRYQDVKDGFHTIYTSMALAIGQRAGKTSTAWFTSPAIMHEFLQMPNPVKFMKQLAVTEFHGTFVGITYEEAYRTVWSPMQRVFATSNWFQTYHQLLNEEGNRLGIELYKLADSFVVYKHKGMMAYASGPDYRKLRGKTRFVGGMDEASYMTGQGVLMNANQVYDALDNSFSTLRAASEQLFKRHPWIPSAYGLYLSSTRTKIDFIVSMVKKSKSISHIYGRRMATWDFNPNMPRDSAFIKGKYAEDPQAAERDFASNPPYANDPYIKSPASIVPLFSKKANVLNIAKYKIAKDSLDTKTMYPIIRTKNIHTLPSILSIDAGYNNNSYAMALMHIMQNVNEESDDYTIGVSGLLEIQPRAGVPLNFPKIYKYVISKIIDNFNVIMIAVDRWQSIDLRQRIYEDHHVDGIQRSLKYIDFETHRKRVFNESIVYPNLDGELDDLLKLEKDIGLLVTEKPMSHLLLQYVTSMDTGRNVIKGEGEDMTDDLLRAVVLGTTIIDDENYTGLFLQDSGIRRNNSFVGAMTGFGSSGNITSVPGIGYKASL